MAWLLVLFAVLVNADSPQSYTTTANLTQKLGRLPGFYFFSAFRKCALDPQSGSVASPDWELFVDDSEQGKRQEITGFGAAWTDATITCFNALSADSQANLLQELFSNDGIHISFMRHTIGQSDLTPNWYGVWSFDNNGGNPDPDLKNFNLTDYGRQMLGWIQRMYTLNPQVQLLGSPWSPPLWMKDKASNVILPNYADAWTNYMVKYLQAYRDAGVKVTAMTIQNEPLHSYDPDWTSFVSASDAVTLTNKLGAALKSANLPTAIWAYDHNTDQPGYPSQVLADAGAYVDTVAWHCYAGNVNWTDLTLFRQSHPGVKQYMTECWLHLQDESFFELPDFMTGPVQNFASGALAWTLGGSTKFDVSWPDGCGQCSGIIQVDRDAKSYVKTQDYYTLGQFSNWTYPDGTGVQATQFLNPDGSRVVVIVNKIVNDLKNFQISFTGSKQVFRGVVPGRSVTTWLIPK